MLSKLAIRNVKRQIGNYSIYFVTVMMTVALIFAINNVIYSPNMEKFTAISPETRGGLVGFSVFTAAIVAFILGYATAFLIRLRKREFGTYLILGMGRADILSIFVIETLLMGLIALALGMILGLLFYQGIMAVISNIMEADVGFASYSSKGVWLTLVLVLLIFTLSSITSGLYLRKVSIHELIYSENKVHRQIKRPGMWFAIAAFSALGLVLGCVIFDKGAKAAGATGANGARMILTAILIAAASIVLFHIAGARSFVDVLLRNKRLKSRGTNTFVLRQLSGRLHSNSIMVGVLAFLFSFSVIFLNVVIVEKVSTDEALDRDCPFDIIGIVSPERTQDEDIKESVSTISEYAQIRDIFYFDLYNSGNNVIYRCTPWSGAGYEGNNDMLITESAYNGLMARLGLSSVDCSQGFYIVAKYDDVTQFDFSDAILENNQIRCGYAGIIQDTPFFFYGFMCVVVPDDFVIGMKAYEHAVAIDLMSGDYDAKGLYEALSYSEKVLTDNGLREYNSCDFIIREIVELDYDGQNAVMIACSIYLAAVFMFMAMAILALKTLSEAAGDKRRYLLLSRLGADRYKLNRALFMQYFIFFALPFVIPILMGVPSCILCVRIVARLGYVSRISDIYVLSGAVIAVITIVYAMYFCATYIIAKRNVLEITD